MKIKKAILTGGGRATRLRPITSTINKHLIKLAGKPMIFHAIEKVVKAGVKEIFINTNPGETELQKEIGNGEKWGVSITFFEQTGGPQGIAHVVKQAQDFIGDDPFIFYLSDNIILNDINNLIEKFENNNYDCMLALSKVEDPERFGVPVLDGDRLVDVIEKPKNPPNNFAVTGIYIYGPKLFFKAYENIEKSDRNDEYEISDVHSYLIKNNYKVGYEEITGWWKDTGKPDDLLLANKLLLEKMGNKEFNNPHKIQIGENVMISDGCVIEGPIIIGDNVKIDNCKLGPFVAVGDSCKLENVGISNSLIFSECNLKAKIKISNSIIGKGVELTDKDVDEHKMIIGEKSVVEL